MKKFTKLQKTIFLILPFLIIPAVYFLGNFLSRYTKYFPPCFTYTALSFNCPGCGITRSIKALLNGEIILSLRQNILPITGIILSVWLYIEFLLYVFEKKPVFSILKEKYVYIGLILLLIYTVLRNIFPSLAPF
ncbi:MAG: DUF2752 domain-containing protein [Ruminococcus sp.]|nr:DUF2752 domain-containing protein [Ruminococcus sp.]